MHQIHDASLAPESMTDAERQEVREQLNRLLETNHFKNSRRYPALLRFIVEETLEGRGEFLKERLLGVQVFDRAPDYDTAADPIVRVTVAEIRKRIAQYYHDEEHDSELRIELLPGHYAPEFRPRGARREAAQLRASQTDLAEVKHSAIPEEVSPISGGEIEASVKRQRPSWLSRWHLALAVLAGVLAANAATPLARLLKPSALDQLWGPLLNSPRAVLFCVPSDAGWKRGPLNESDVVGQSTGSGITGADGAGPTFRDFETLGQNVVYSDMQASLHMANVLATHHKDYRTKLNVAATLDDLRQGPTILVGALDNQWTMRALSSLPYGMAGNDQERYWITDAKHPDKKDWSLDLTRQFVAVTRDYAIVARRHNEQTGQMEMIVAGIGMSGTAAAGELMGDERSAQQLRQKIGPGFKDHDFEVVLSTDVVNGIAGEPKIIAVAVW